MNAAPPASAALPAEAAARDEGKALTFLNLVFAAIIVYVPYQQHFPVVLNVAGLNLTNVLVSVALLGVLLRKDTGPPAAPTPAKGAFVLLFVLLVLAFLTGQLRDGSRMVEDLTALKTAVFYPLLYFIYYHGVRDVRSTRMLFGTILLVTFLVSLQAVRQGLDYGVVTFQDTKRASGPFAKDYFGANLAAGYFVIFVPVVFAVAVICKSRPFVRLAALGCTLLGIFGVFFTFSRQAYVILPALMLLLGLRRNLFLAVVVVISLATYESWVPQSVIDRVLVTEQVDSRGDKKLDESTASRFIIWEGAGKLIAESPMGIGLNHFKREIGRHVPEYENFDAHNGFVLLSTEASPLAGITLLFLLLRLLAIGYRVDRFELSEDSRLFGSAMLVATAGVILANLFGSRIFQGEVTGNYWILAGMVARYYTIEHDRITAKNVARSERTRPDALAGLPGKVR